MESMFRNNTGLFVAIFIATAIALPVYAEDKPATPPAQAPAGASSTVPAAVLICLITGVLSTLSVFLVERVLKIDDPVGAISGHGTNGAWRGLALGLFADGKYGDGFNGVKGTVTGFLYGDSGQFVAQYIGTLTNMIVIFVISFVFFKNLNAVVGLRVAKDIELGGFDQAEVTVSAYPGLSLRHLPLGGGYYPHKPRRFVADGGASLPWMPIR